MPILTSAIVIANGEAINVLRDANVPEEQLIPVAGGERIPLFLKTDRDRASAGETEAAPGVPGAPLRPHDRFAVMERHVFSHFDGGQLAFNFLIHPGKTLFWSAHMGAYEGVIKRLEPKPDIAILAIAGRANLDGRPFDGSAADFIVKKIDWLGQPKTVIWCLHDESPIRPYRVDTTGAEKKVHSETRSRIQHLDFAVPTEI
ncbi:hypothetical protein NW754_007680 [Fusarium falciforme]|nr:hypothetical protein NW754_007680 [Fusarium falciforme]